MREYTVKQAVAEHNGVYDAWEVGIVEATSPRDALVRFLQESKTRGSLRAYRNIRPRDVNSFYVEVDADGWAEEMFILE